MNSFFEYMDKIKAEEKLKENTIVFVRKALAAGAQQRESEVLKKSAYKKIAVAISSVAACVVLAAAGYAYYNTPVNYVSLDINPSVELGVNAFGSVICADGYNADGNSILKGHKLKNQSLEEAISILVQEAAEQGFITEDGSTVIAVTAQSDDEETAAELQETSRAGVDLALDICSTDAVVYTDCSCLRFRTEARELGISPGKYKLISVLQELDPSITIETYKDAKVTDIITKANEYLTESPNSDVNGENAQSLEIIAQAARDVLAAKGCTEKDQNTCSRNMNTDQECEDNDPEQETDEDSAIAEQNQAEIQSASASEQDKGQTRTSGQDQAANASASGKEQGKAQTGLQQSQSQSSSDVKQNQGQSQDTSDDKQNQGQGSCDDKQNQGQIKGSSNDKQNKDQDLSSSEEEKEQKPNENSSSDQKTKNEDEKESAKSKTDDKDSKDNGSTESKSEKNGKSKS
ncbi:MAG: hypothetical protein AB7C97_02210 [Oscillospiraceae bacterium]